MNQTFSLGRNLEKKLATPGLEERDRVSKETNFFGLLCKSGKARTGKSLEMRKDHYTNLFSEAMPNFKQ